jgi:hypothetical protein
MLQMPVQHQEQRQIALQLLRDEEILFHMLVTMLSQLCGDLWVRQQKANLIGGAFDRMREKAVCL